MVADRLREEESNDFRLRILDFGFTSAVKQQFLTINNYRKDEGGSISPVNFSKCVCYLRISFLD